jgi:hypothetical protein
MVVGRKQSLSAVWHLLKQLRMILGVKATHREVIEAGETYELRESAEAYAGKFTGKNDALSPENTIRWDEIVDDARR